MLKRLLVFLAMGISFLLGYAGAQVISGGVLGLHNPFFNAGGSGQSLVGGTLSLLHSIGQGAVTPMSGGTLNLTPGLTDVDVAARTDLELAHAFPTPFRPRMGHDRITFRNLGLNARIRVYTLSGQLVRTFPKTDGATQDLVWYPVSDDHGRSVASGVYLYVIEGDSGRKTGKLMIIR
ncbi:MAG: T9SS type A sorting domain-containing protein, partial [Elusimicrobiota bacterium]